MRPGAETLANGGAISDVDFRQVSGDARAVKGLGRQLADAVRPLGELSEPGKILEITSAGGALTIAAEVVRQAQEAGEVSCWIARADSDLFPPALAEGGLDLESLVFVHVPSTRRGSIELGRAAEMVLQSSGFGCVVIDFGSRGTKDRVMWQRLARAASSSIVRLVVLTPRSEGSASVFVDRLVRPVRRRSVEGFELAAEVVKSRSPQSARWRQVFRPPSGL